MSRRICARTPGRDLMRVASAEPAVAVRQQPERDQPGADQTRPSAPAARQPPPPEWPPAGWRWLEPPDHADRDHHERHQHADRDGPPCPYAASCHLETLAPHRLDPPGRPPYSCDSTTSPAASRSSPGPGRMRAATPRTTNAQPSTWRPTWPVTWPTSRSGPGTQPDPPFLAPSF